MNTLSKTIDISGYMPPELSEARMHRSLELCDRISLAVSLQIPIGFEYDGNTRLVLPHSIFMQHSEAREDMPIIPSEWRTGMRTYKKKPAKAIGIDAWQVKSENRDSRNGWKTFHLHEIDGLILLTREVIKERLGFKSDEISDDVHLENGFTTVPTFIRNWNYWFRDFITQAPSKKDLRDVNPRIRILHPDINHSPKETK